MKSEKGMTLLTTAILVFIIATLVFAVVYYTRMQLAKEKLEDLKTNMLLIQAKVKAIDGEYILNKKEETLKGQKITDMQENSSIKEFLEKNIIDIQEKEKKYYVLNQETLNEMELKITLEENTYYIVEYNTKEIYTSKGFTYSDGNTYYKLTEIENLGIDEK